MATILKKVYQCADADAPKGAAFLAKVVEDLKDVLDFNLAFISPLERTITTEQDLDHSDYPVCSEIEVEVPDLEEHSEEAQPAASQE